MGCKCTKNDLADCYGELNSFHKWHDHVNTAPNRNINPNTVHTSTHNNTHSSGCNGEHMLVQSNVNEHQRGISSDNVNPITITTTTPTKQQRRKIEYNSDVFNLINKIRQHPSSFATDIENAISNITTVNNKLIYSNGIVNVSLNEGEPAFKQAANHLRQMLPLPPLQLYEPIAIMVPYDESQMKNTNIFHELVAQHRHNHIEIDSYFKDLIKDPYTSVLLMIIDDNGKSNNTRKKRDVVLGREYTKMAVTSRQVNKTFCAYLTFAK